MITFHVELKETLDFLGSKTNETVVRKWFQHFLLMFSYGLIELVELYKTIYIKICLSPCFEIKKLINYQGNDGKEPFSLKNRVFFKLENGIFSLI